MASEIGRAVFVYLTRLSAQQRVHCAALLTLLLFAAPLAAQDIDFDPAITQAEFETFTNLVGQTLYATPVDPARGRGLLGFEIGIAATAIAIDEDASYWVRSVGSDFLQSGYLMVPRVVVSKGLGFANLSASYARIPSTSIDLIGGALDVPIFDGGLVRPTLAVRGAYSQLRGVDELDMKVYGAELFLSKGFGPITPYVGAGIQRTDAEAEIVIDPRQDPVLFRNENNERRITAGVRLTLLLPKLVVEATEAHDRTYAARVSIGF